jgi:hypothetical protein
MPNLPISGLPVVTVPNRSYTIAAVSASVTSQMTLSQVAAAISSSFTASQAISASYAVSASYEINIETSSSYADTASFVTGSNVYGPFGSNSIISSSYAVSASFAPIQVSASYATTASYALNANVFPYTGSALITGSLGVTGSVLFTGSFSAGTVYVGNAGGNSSTNVAVGRVSLASNTSGVQNTAIGEAVLTSNTTGIQNTAVGQSSLSTVAGGSRNVAIGYQTIVGVAGDENTGVGTEALQVTTGTRNTGLGFRSGFYFTSGNNNTILGSYTGSFGMPAVNNNIIISDGTGDVKFWYNSGSGGVIELLDNIQVTGSISQTSVTNSLIKANASGQLVAAVGGTDYTPPAYLSAFHTASLTVPSPNTPNTMSFSTVDFAQGVTVSGSWNDKIKVTNGGIYNLQFSAATTKTTGTTATVDIWLRKNESDLSYTNTIVTLAGGSNDFAVPAWNFFLSASAGDYYQLMFASPTTNPYIAYAASGSTGVAVQVPSVILTVNRVG